MEKSLSGTFLASSIWGITSSFNFSSGGGCDLAASAWWGGNLTRSLFGAVAHPRTDNRMRENMKRVFVFILILLYPPPSLLPRWGGLGWVAVFPRQLMKQDSETK